MPRDYADAAAHQSIPDGFLWCLLTRRHSFPPPRNEVKVRLQCSDNPSDTMDIYESVGECGLCGTVRTYWRDQTTKKFVFATYERPDGYDPPPGLLWDREYLWTLYYERHPVKGRTQVRKR